ncbi:MAG: hypothetical protein BWY77_00872 [bacterium ADurb.Bin431]|nr:MAG: hypothetical protein BWY77_00872 [bacterium ADurb.Bin431]
MAIAAHRGDLGRRQGTVVEGELGDVDGRILAVIVTEEKHLIGAIGAVKGKAVVKAARAALTQQLPIKIIIIIIAEVGIDDQAEKVFGVLDLVEGVAGGLEAESTVGADKKVPVALGQVPVVVGGEKGIPDLFCREANVNDDGEAVDARGQGVGQCWIMAIGLDVVVAPVKTADADIDGAIAGGRTRHRLEIEGAGQLVGDQVVACRGLGQICGIVKGPMADESFGRQIDLRQGHSGGEQNQDAKGLLHRGCSFCHGSIQGGNTIFATPPAGQGKSMPTEKRWLSSRMPQSDQA